MIGFANDYHLIPEQVWDGPDIPDRELFHGRPAGAAMPLVWAHAEYVKLLRSLADGRVFDLPPQGRQRYLVDRGDVAAGRRGGRTTSSARSPPGQGCGSNSRRPAYFGGPLATGEDPQVELSDSGLGMYFADLDTGQLPAGATVTFSCTGEKDSEVFSVAVAAVETSASETVNTPR